MPDNPTTQKIAAASGVVLQVGVRSTDQLVEILIERQSGPTCVLHWGLAHAGGASWQQPPKSSWPPGSTPADHAVDTPLAEGTATVRLDADARFAFFDFVLFDPKTSRWDNNHGHNYRVALPLADSRFDDAHLRAVADQIIEHETSPNSWTLMHRFNLAWDLLDRVPQGSVSGLALIFVWLRFSAIRQLDWQRKYNTQPRELAHAQDRLTLKLGERAAQADDETRPWLRMIAGTLGRGGEGQRVRDGILEIMHRHHLKEVAGHFLEEWHQKLHNNTTPDDVVICEAYLEFLRTSGDQAAFCRVLEAGGISRERLLSFERPIRSHPDFVPHLRDALLHDFGDFLGVLRSLHSATDFGVSLQAARGFVDQPTRQLLDGIWQRREDPQARSWLLQSIAQAREVLAGQFHPGQPGLRDLLYLDLGLEDLLRGLVERNLHERLSPDELMEWTHLALRNLVLTRKSAELSLCLRHLSRLLRLPRGGHDWALHAQAVLERIRRELVCITDADARLLAPIAEQLGKAFGAASWTIAMFSEEVLRGRIEFAVSALLRKFDELLRQIAGVGHWQVVSRGHSRAEGVIQNRSSLAEAQGHRFDTSTVLVAGRITGEEEIPTGVVAVLTDCAVDLMSHLAVRARNAGVLLATSWDAGRSASLREREGEWVRLSVAAEGEILVEAAEPSAARRSVESPIRAAQSVAFPRPSSEYAIAEQAFDANNVGAKSRNLKELRGRLPNWISVPAGIAVPYGVYERVLGEPCNQACASRYHALVRQSRATPAGEIQAILAGLRQVTLELDPPAGLETELRRVMSAAGVPWSGSFSDAWMCIKRVWASKWNDRAHLSRRSMGIPDESVMMAVLVQEVVQADYAFVIHTANPITGDPDELVVEIVLGLGETLVGNHPGRALGFRRQRSKRTAPITSFPSKSVGLFGEGLMFRSDSSGEDLMGFAGAGLYDSFMLPQARRVLLDYEKEELLWNEDLCNRVLEGVADVGVAVEKVFGAPQDIEGTYAKGRFFVVQARPQVGLDHG
jgi:alpha-glucan,water dikinase